MTTRHRYREIPYNYTSFSDREIIGRYFDNQTWELLQTLRKHRVTGRSAKLLFDVIGDIFAIERNPYIFDDFLHHPGKRAHLQASHQRKLSTIRKGSRDSRVDALVETVDRKSRQFFESFRSIRKRTQDLKALLSRHTNGDNIAFSPYHKVIHVTDATDWRVEYPEVVLYPETDAEVAALVKAAPAAGLCLIPRGGGTGLTGGAIPIRRHTAIINTEKLNRIGEIHNREIAGRSVPVIEVEAGVITDAAAQRCRAKGVIFATDPTSAWASTIGGNIAENCGGKKAVMWGTAIDNLLSFKLVDPNGDILEIRRRNHPYRKIKHDDTVVFDVFNLSTRTASTSDVPDVTISLEGTDIRKTGIGKDITNKALKGLPGVQKEGGDGVIVSAVFVLYTPFAHTHTACLEFFGDDLTNAADAIVTIRDTFDENQRVFLTALEHFDDKYADAIAYRNKSMRTDRPRAILLVDLASNDAGALRDAGEQLVNVAAQYNCEAFLATEASQRVLFWSDRKNLGAIARHTNAFKLNEDVVIPIAALPQFATFVETLNRDKDNRNQQACARQLIATIDATTVDDGYFQARKDRALQVLNGPAPCDFSAVVTMFGRYEDIRRSLEMQLAAERNRRIVIATHMHAGDGNIHVNIPVHSGDYEMMREADETAGEIMLKTVELGGVVSGEHGIGLTKLRFVDAGILKDYRDYKQRRDPGNLFNPGKLESGFAHDTVYTPSLNLLKKEALILEAVDLQDLTHSISSCVRCGKCKQDCNTQYPEGNMLYCPRNKNLAVSLITEAILFDAQIGGNLGVGNFRMLKEIANHCTMCHNCLPPCPVDIDFGEVTLAIRRLLTTQKKNRSKPLTRLTLYYLRRRGYHTNRLFRIGLLRMGFSAQRVAHYLHRPFLPLARKVAPVLSHLLDGRFPKTGDPSIREVFRLNQPETFYCFTPPSTPVKQSVLYFPGCGSERMFAPIAMASLAMLYDRGIRVVIPPNYMCCGYPLVANGQTHRAGIIANENCLTFHRMAETVSYMDVRHVLVSCGTCKEMLSRYAMNDIFSDSIIMDVNEYLVQQGVCVTAEDTAGDDPCVLYHEPCHSPLGAIGYEKTVTALLGSRACRIPNCCGEGGTLALSTPHISTILRQRKRQNIARAFSGEAHRVLTTCPSCVQGLSKNHHDICVTGIPLIVAVAERHLGPRWQRRFAAHVKKHRAIEYLLF